MAERRFNEVSRDMDRGHSWGEFAVRKAVAELWPTAEIYSCEEGRANKVATLLDTACGIDWLLYYRELVKGISVRTQKSSYAHYQTLTIRNKRTSGATTKDSELAKAILASEQDGIGAAYHLHAYVDVDKGPATGLRGWCLAKRPELFRWVWENHSYLRQDQTEDVSRGQIQTFYYVPFDQIPDEFVVAYRVGGGIVAPEPLELDESREVKPTSLDTSQAIESPPDNLPDEDLFDWYSEQLKEIDV